MATRKSTPKPVGVSNREIGANIMGKVPSLKAKPANLKASAHEIKAVEPEPAPADLTALFPDLPTTVHVTRVGVERLTPL